MKVHIEVVISTAGNDAEYIGKHFGEEILGRPLKNMVVTFEEEVTEDEYYFLVYEQRTAEEFCKKLRLGVNALQIHSFRVTRNIYH